MKELSRQLVHLSGILFVILGQFIGSSGAAVVFFLIAFTFLLYSLYIIREERRLERFIGAFEQRVRKLAYKFERPGIPFQGAFWFYMGCGIAFWIFPLPVATAACLVLAIADSLATIVGERFGSRRLLEGKSVEGTVMFFLTAVVIAFVFSPGNFLFPALAAMAGELIPGLVPRLRAKGLVDDNLLIPLFAGAALVL